MALNMEIILKQTGETQEEFAEAIGVSIEELNLYSNGEKKPSVEIYGKISSYTGLSWEQIESGKKTLNYAEFNISDTWSPSEEAKTSLEEYLSEGVSSFDEKTVLREIEQIKTGLKNWRKPRISIAGQSDTGKSTLINALLGCENMPAKYTPTTSIVVYIKHMKDKPSFITENVCIFRKVGNRLWDDSLLNDEDHLNTHLLVKGDYSLLETYGTHQNQSDNGKEASSAVVFIDSSLLEDCDVIDLPGFAASDEDNAIHKFNIQEGLTDVLIYLSRSNGFLQDRDLDYLNICINSLKCIENSNNSFANLENLFIVASQSGNINGGNAYELNEILDTQCHKLCNILRHSIETRTNSDVVRSLLPKRSDVTGKNYVEKDFRSRFFTYERDMPRLCKAFIKSFTELIERLPEENHKSFMEELKKIASQSKTSIGNKIKEYEKMIEEKESYIELVKEIDSSEPGRLAEQMEKREKVLRSIKEFNTDSKLEYKKFITEYLSEENLVSEMIKAGVNNKKSDKQDFVSLVGKVIVDQAQDVMDEYAQKYTKIVDSYIEDYGDKISAYSAASNINIEFDAIGAFSMGIQKSLAKGILGASALWLSSNVISSIIVPVAGIIAPGAWIAAIGGIVTLVVTAAVIGLISIFDAITWKKDLANKIIKEYTENEFETKMMESYDKYWNDTEKSFNSGAEEMENEWKERIEEYKQLADEKNVHVFVEKLNELNRGLIFFEKMPLPRVF